MKWTLGCCVLAIITVGCATTSAIQLGGESTRSAVPWEEVKVYREASQVPGRYEEVAMLHGTGNWQASGEGTVYNSMRKKAGEMGANALILEGMSEPSAGAKVASAIFGVGGAERKGNAIAIYILPIADSTAATK